MKSRRDTFPLEEFIPSCDRGFQASLKKGQLLGSPIIGVRVVLTDGQFHPVDSSTDLAFQLAAQGAFKQAYKKAKPQLLEPIMKVVVETPSEYSGHVFASLQSAAGHNHQFSWKPVFLHD